MLTHAQTFFRGVVLVGLLAVNACAYLINNKNRGNFLSPRKSVLFIESLFVSMEISCVDNKSYIFESFEINGLAGEGWVKFYSQG
jgi:hypothetical protein